MEKLRLGDSVVVMAGSGEILFISGVRVPVARGERTAITEPPAGGGRLVSSLRAALIALARLVTGNPAQPSSVHVAMEAETAGGSQGRLGTADSLVPHGVGGHSRRLQLPTSLHPWIVLPEQPAIWWDLFPDPGAQPVLVRIYPASTGEGCPPAGRALIASTFESPAALRSALAGRLETGGRYRVELGFGPALEAGCVQVALPSEQEFVRAQLAALRTEYTAGEALHAGDYGLPLLEAALLADQGYGADALLRLAPLVTASGVPLPVLELWMAIVGQGTVPTPDG